MKLKLYIGDKNLSSWSLRPWLVLKKSGLPFEEILIPLDRPETSKQIKNVSPTGRVPCLHHEGLAIWDSLTIWDSLAISEYIAEIAAEAQPRIQLWPAGRAEKATARAYCAEMHSGFSGLRQQLSMDLRLRMEIVHLQQQTIQDIQRVLELWEQALQKSQGPNSQGPFLFGKWSIADAFYTPVVFRFQSYGIQIRSERIKIYMKEVLKDPAVREWEEAAFLEKPVRLEF